MDNGIFFEALNGIVRLFLNMSLYWAFILILLSGYKRINRERSNFGFKVFDIFSEWKGTWGISLISGLIISLVTLGIGIVFTYETILIISILIIILSLNYNFSMLSASYTIGITYILFFLMPSLLNYLSFQSSHLFSNPNFTGLVILISLFLIVESFLLRKTDRNKTYPQLELSNRGRLIGSHQLKKISLIPFFVLIPSGLITPLAPFWPYFTLGGETYSLLLVPLILGYQYTVRGSLPNIIAKQLSNQVLLLGIIVLIVSIGSVFLPWLSLLAVIVAIIGRELINYNFRTKDKEKAPYFTELKEGVQVLSIIPGSPADELNILVGEKIVKVNDQPINTVTEFYEALKLNAAFYKLDVLNDDDEVRFERGTIYEEDHHELGIIFITDRYRDFKLS